MNLRKKSTLKTKETGAHVPLFDRLIDLDPDSLVEHTPLRTLDRQGLYASVAKELHLLLNTRPASHAGSTPELALPDHFGLSDFASLPAMNDLGRRHLIREIERVVTYYEPRLKNVRATLAPNPDDPMSALVTIVGDLTLETLSERTTFAVRVEAALTGK